MIRLRIKKESSGEEIKERYAKYLDKIIHIVVDKFPEFSPVGNDDYWEIENFQRIQACKCLKNLNLKSRDIVLFTDVDEIIRREKIDKIISLINSENILYIVVFVIIDFSLI